MWIKYETNMVKYAYRPTNALVTALYMLVIRRSSPRPAPWVNHTLMAPHRTPPGPPRTPQGATRVSTCGNEGGLIYIEFCIWTNIFQLYRTHIQLHI